MKILSGSCLCGKIRYESKNKLGDISYCHCSMCQKAHGSAFGPYGSVAWEDFKFTFGEEYVQTFKSSPEVSRTFCKNCGSTLQFIRDGKPTFGLAVGTLDKDPVSRPTVQIWCTSKAPWFELDTNIPFYDAYPPRD